MKRKRGRETQTEREEKLEGRREREGERDQMPTEKGLRRYNTFVYLKALLKTLYFHKMHHTYALIYEGSQGSAFSKKLKRLVKTN